jgi:hypothetical protein
MPLNNGRRDGDLKNTHFCSLRAFISDGGGGERPQDSSETRVEKRSGKE